MALPQHQEVVLIVRVPWSQYLMNRHFRTYLYSIKHRSRRRGDDGAMLYVGAPSTGNLGDRMLFQALCELFDGIALVPCPPPALRRRPSLSRLWERAFRGRRSLSAVLLGGGTIVNDPVFLSQLKSQNRGRPLLLFGSGVRDPDFEGNCLEEWRPWLETLSCCFVRDEFSAETLKAVGVDAEVIGDPVLSLIGSRPLQTGTVDRGVRVGLNVGCEGKQFGRQRDVVRALSTCISELISRNVSVEFFAMHRSDESRLRELRSSLGLDRIRIHGHQLGTKRWLQQLSRMDVTVGQRLHSSIAACALGIPSVSLSYRRKCRDFMKSLGMAEYAVSTAGLEAESLLDKVLQLIESRSSVEQDLRRRVDVFRKLQQQAAATARQCLKTGL
jgi:polysaccharide pyruvyl transferase WcaK-like protein